VTAGIVENKQTKLHRERDTEKRKTLSHAANGIMTAICCVRSLETYWYLSHYNYYPINYSNISSHSYHLSFL